MTRQIGCMAGCKGHGRCIARLSPSLYSHISPDGHRTNAQVFEQREAERKNAELEKFGGLKFYHALHHRPERENIPERLFISVPKVTYVYPDTYVSANDDGGSQDEEPPALVPSAEGGGDGDGDGDGNDGDGDDDLPPLIPFLAPPSPPSIPASWARRAFTLIRDPVRLAAFWPHFSRLCASGHISVAAGVLALHGIYERVQLRHSLSSYVASLLRQGRGATAEALVADPILRRFISIRPGSDDMMVLSRWWRYHTLPTVLRPVLLYRHDLPTSVAISATGVSMREALLILKFRCSVWRWRVSPEGRVTLSRDCLLSHGGVAVVRQVLMSRELFLVALGRARGDSMVIDERPREDRKIFPLIHGHSAHLGPRWEGASHSPMRRASSTGGVMTMKGPVFDGAVEEGEGDVLVRRIAVALPRELGVKVGSYLEATAQVVRRLERQPLPDWLGGW